MNLQPTTPAEVQEAVRSQAKVLPRGNGTKLALSTPPEGVASLNLAELSGVIEYEPGEFTFTAQAGTPVSEVQAMLAEQGQYLPFDPLLVKKGATLGGVVASGTGGPRRYRYGGVRDFLIGVRFVDGAGQLVRGGGKVVKNSAGFDLSKLLVGSIGRLGVLTEVTFKVFPAPHSYSTLRVELAGLGQAIETIQTLTTSPLELDALDLEPPGRLWIRLGGLPEALPDRLRRMRDFLRKTAGEALNSVEIVPAAEEQPLWEQMQELAWVPPGWGLIKVPLTPARLPGLEARLDVSSPNRLDGPGAIRRYSAAGNVGWVAWSPEAAETGEAATFFKGIDSILTRLDLPGLVLWGPPGQPFIGLRHGEGLLRRVKQALDAEGRFLEY